MIDLIKPEDREEYEKLAKEIDEEHRKFRASIANRVAKLKELNPLYEIYQYRDGSEPNFTNQTFGQKFSEPFIRNRTPNLTKYNGTGHDVRGKNYAIGEIKSSQSDFDKDWTLNQVKVNKSDMLIGAWYNARQGTMRISCAPMEEVKKLRRSPQHSDSKDVCATLSNNKRNHDFFKHYEVHSFEELNEKV